VSEALINQVILKRLDGERMNLFIQVYEAKWSEPSGLTWILVDFALLVNSVFCSNYNVGRDLKEWLQK